MQIFPRNLINELIYYLILINFRFDFVTSLRRVNSSLFTWWRAPRRPSCLQDQWGSTSRTWGSPSPLVFLLSSFIPGTLWTSGTILQLVCWNMCGGVLLWPLWRLKSGIPLEAMSFRSLMKVLYEFLKKSTVFLMCDGLLTEIWTMNGDRNITICVTWTCSKVSGSIF